MQNRSRFLKAFDTFGMVIAVLVVLTWMYGLQVRNWYRARDLKKTHPAVSLVPRPLPDTSTVPDKGMTLAAFGYQIDVPWTRLEVHKNAPAVALYRFSGGIGLTFWNPAKMTGMVAMVREAVERAHRRFTDFFGVRTEYDLLDSELKATPEQMSPFMKKREAFRQGVLLNMKESELNLEPSAVYSFTRNGLRAFQLGDPAKDRVVEIRSFDAGDREFQFVFAVGHGSNVKLDQREINSVIGSLRIAEPPPDSTASRP